MMEFDEKYFGNFSREAMRILRAMVKQWPTKKTFTNEELGKLISLKGRGLGGVMGAFSKKGGEPLVIKIGTITVGWQGQKYSRPKQVWAINPRLKKKDIENIHNILGGFLLE